MSKGIHKDRKMREEEGPKLENRTLNFFPKSNLAQTMCPIVIYNHAKNWEVP